MSTNFTITRDQIIISALRKLGMVEPADLGSSVDPNIITNASQTLNLMIKMWAVDGLKIWTIDELSLPLQANKTTYSIGPGSDLITNKPLKLIQAWLRNTSVTPNIDTPMQLLSKQEYNVLGSKASTGTANSVFLDPRVNNSILYAYLIPDVATASNYQMHLVVQRMMQDVNLSTDTPDFPTEWMQALVWNLADQLALENSVPASFRQEIAMRALGYKEQMSSWDVESTSTFFTPDTRFGYHR